MKVSKTNKATRTRDLVVHGRDERAQKSGRPGAAAAQARGGTRLPSAPALPHLPVCLLFASIGEARGVFESPYGGYVGRL